MTCAAARLVSRGGALTPALSQGERGRPHPGPLLGGEGAPSPRPSPANGRGGALTPALSQGERGSTSLCRFDERSEEKS